VVLDRDLRVVSANDSFCKEFSCSSAEAEGRSIYDLGDKQWDIPELRSLLEKVIPKNQTVEGFEVDRELPGKGRIKVILNARKVKHEAGVEGLPEEFILLAMEQVTQKK
jgi:PAS domain-containing protein